MKRSQGSVASWMVAVLMLWGCGSKATLPSTSSTGGAKPESVVKASEVVVAGDIAHKDAACRACRATYCTLYDGVVNLVDKCFSSTEPSFVKQCTAAMNCAYEKKCGSTAEGALECFCGSADVPTCLKPGGANGPCQAEWLAAARTQSVKELSERFGDLAFPAGIANYFVACDRDNCQMCRPQGKNGSE